MLLNTNCQFGTEYLYTMQFYKHVLLLTWSWTLAGTMMDDGNGLTRLSQARWANLRSFNLAVRPTNPRGAHARSFESFRNGIYRTRRWAEGKLRLPRRRLAQGPHRHGRRRDMAGARTAATLEFYRFTCTHHP